MDCSYRHGYLDDYGVYRHGQFGERVLFVDEWCSFLHGDGVDEWDELHVYGYGNECVWDK